MGQGSHNPHPDLELVRKVSSGEKAALRELYERYSHSLGLFAQSWLKDPLEASDIVQETMLELWRSAHRFEGKSSVKTWLFTIARNKSVDRNRKGTRTVLQETEPELVDESPDPQAVTEAFQDAKRVRACIETLNAVQKSAIHLAFYEDLSYPEIAEMEQSPVGTIKTRIMHAKALLLRCLGG